MANENSWNDDQQSYGEVGAYGEGRSRRFGARGPDRDLQRSRGRGPGDDRAQGSSDRNPYFGVSGERSWDADPAYGQGFGDGGYGRRTFAEPDRYRGYGQDGGFASPRHAEAARFQDNELHGSSRYGQNLDGSYGPTRGSRPFAEGSGAHAGEHRGRGPKGYTRSDERIAEDVNDRLTEDPRLDATGVTISVKEGEVTLAGAVHNRHDKRLTEDLTDAVSGVRHVQNNLRVHDSNYNAATSMAGSPDHATPTASTPGTRTSLS